MSLPPLMLGVGNERTDTVKALSLEQGVLLVPVTRYVVCVVGKTMMRASVLPLSQWYVLAPETTNTAVSPRQMVEVPVMLRTGRVSKTTCLVAVLEQPKLLVTVTV